MKTKKVIEHIVIMVVIGITLMVTSFSCEKMDAFDTNLHINDTLKIKIGTTVWDNQHTSGLSFDSVVAESRCPADVVCVWAGYAAGKFTFRDATNEYTFTLSTINLNQPLLKRDTVVNGYKITLINILPYPDTRIKINPHERFALLRVTHE